MAKPSKDIGTPRPREPKGRRRLRDQFARWGARVGLPMLTLAQLRAEDQAGYRHESYREENSRIRVETDSFLVQKLLTPWLDLKATATYDAISGATPTGAPAADSFTLHPTGTTLAIPGTSITTFKKAGRVDAVSGASPAASAKSTPSSSVPIATVTDLRQAFDVSAGLIYGPHRLTPEFSYSQESDYLSLSGALNYAWELNDKTTTLKAGWSYSADTIVPNANTFITRDQSKNSDDFLLGVTQLLGPKTVFDFNVALGFAKGYFDDPYRGVVFSGELPSPMNTLTLYQEKRPGTRNKQSAYVALTEAISPLDASVEVSYRYYHDSFDIHAHTVNLAWHQKVGSFLVLTPSARYYRQTAASFYGTIFPGDPVTNPSAVPAYYSADYRLSELDAFTVGLQATVKIREWLALDLGYQRYVMNGLDGVTSASAYPSANIVTLGLRVWF